MITAEAKRHQELARKFADAVKKLEDEARNQMNAEYAKLSLWSRSLIGGKSSLVAVYETPFSLLFRGIEYGKAVGGDVYNAYEGKRLKEYAETSAEAKERVARVVALAVSCNFGDAELTAKLMKLDVAFVNSCCSLVDVENDNVSVDGEYTDGDAAKLGISEEQVETLIGKVAAAIKEGFEALSKALAEMASVNLEKIPEAPAEKKSEVSEKTSEAPKAPEEKKLEVSEKTSEAPKAPEEKKPEVSEKRPQVAGGNVNSNPIPCPT